MLRSAVEGANKLRIAQRPMVTFIDPNGAYDGHRFCEPDVEEPAPGRDDTWIFLSGWLDNSLPGNADSRIASTLQDVADLSVPPNVTLPDAAICDTSYDWADQMLCGLQAAKLVTQGENGAVVLDDKISTDEIHWYYPTRSVKTFHPKSLGHLAYVNLIKDAA